jgi:hypothetical protein
MKYIKKFENFINEAGEPLVKPAKPITKPETPVKPERPVRPEKTPDRIERPEQNPDTKASNPPVVKPPKPKPIPKPEKPKPVRINEPEKDPRPKAEVTELDVAERFISEINAKGESVEKYLK